MKLKLYELEGNEPEILLRALLLGLRPDGVRMILRAAIEKKISDFSKIGARFVMDITEEGRKIDITCVRNAGLYAGDMRSIHALENLYNTIDEWGCE